MKQEEKEFVDKLIKPLTNHFNIQQEVKSKCGKGRIDLVLQSKENDNIYFGVECKKPDKKRGEEMARFVKQAIRYTDYEFLTSKGIYLCEPLRRSPVPRLRLRFFGKTSKLLSLLTGPFLSKILPIR